MLEILNSKILQIAWHSPTKLCVPLLPHDSSVEKLYITWLDFVLQTGIKYRSSPRLCATLKLPLHNCWIILKIDKWLHTCHVGKFDSSNFSKYTIMWFCREKFWQIFYYVSVAKQVCIGWEYLMDITCSLVKCCSFTKFVNLFPPNFSAIWYFESAWLTKYH